MTQENNTISWHAAKHMDQILDMRAINMALMVEVAMDQRE